MTLATWGGTNVGSAQDRFYLPSMQEDTKTILGHATLFEVQDKARNGRAEPNPFDSVHEGSQNGLSYY